MTPPLISSLNSNPFPSSFGSYPDPAMAVLAPSSGLLYIFSFGFSGLPDRFPVSYLGLADVSFDAEFPLHPVDDDLEMQFSHPGNQGLVSLLVRCHLESRIFFRQLA